eukprot:5626690-Prymnesium_polylepis.1
MRYAGVTGGTLARDEPDTPWLPLGVLHSGCRREAQRLLGISATACRAALQSFGALLRRGDRGGHGCAG